ncbi:MAG: hypothetical protein Q7J35_12890 [Candidatus Methanoperedens sp.]|nr:hypothetical protein [Candidatus Methanoperedens sp.]
MKRSKSALALIGLLFIILLTPYAAVAAPSVYTVLVDDNFGFKKVRVEPIDPAFKYDNLTLMINPGDSVKWMNYIYDPSGIAYKNNVPITIVSVQNLWDNQSGYLRNFGRSFNYTFDRPGSYEVYMKEFPKVRHQTIIVAQLETPVATTLPPTPTETQTPAPTASVTQTPQAATPGFDLWYILLAFIVVAILVVLIYSFKKK